MYRTLLVPLDGSPFGEQALPLAVALAHKANALVEVVHVHSPSEYYSAPSAAAPMLEQEAQREKQAYLDGIAARLTAEHHISARGRLLTGNAADALYDHVAAGTFDLVIMTTHGRGPLTRFWLGGVANDLMRRLPVPLLLIRPGESDLASAIAMRRMLIPLDGSALAEQVLEPALQLSGLLDMEITLLRVIDPILMTDERLQRTTLFSRSLYVESAALREQQQADARKYLEDMTERLSKDGRNVKSQIAQSFSPAEAILEEAEKENHDLIALATQGQSGLARLFLGSVADKVVRGADVPVLVYRPRSS